MGITGGVQAAFWPDTEGNISCLVRRNRKENK